MRAFAWDGRVLADLRHGGGPGRVAVAVDDEAGIGLQDGGGVEVAGEAFGDAGDADVPGDVALAFGFRHAEVVQGFRNCLAGVIGGEEQVGPAGCTQDSDGGWVFGGEQHLGSRCSGLRMR